MTTDSKKFWRKIVLWWCHCLISKLCSRYSVPWFLTTAFLSHFPFLAPKFYFVHPARHFYSPWFSIRGSWTMMKMWAQLTIESSVFFVDFMFLQTDFPVQFGIKHESLKILYSNSSERTRSLSSRNSFVSASCVWNGSNSWKQHLCSNTQSSSNRRRAPTFGISWSSPTVFYKNLRYERERKIHWGLGHHLGSFWPKTGIAKM